MNDVTITQVGPERIPDLEPLTRALHRYHVTVDPAIFGVPPRDEDGWWLIRSVRYREWLATDPDAFVLVAETGDALVGYALVTFHGADDSHRTGDKVAELQSLVVLDDRRGVGIGSALLHEVYAQVRARGAEEMIIGVLATNDRVRRLYEREGFTPWVVLTMGKVPEP